MAEPSNKPDKRLAAVCGLFCPACTIYIGTQDDPERLKPLAQMMNVPVEALYCDGCRMERRNTFCTTCKMSKCAVEKGIDFCIECAEYPCAELKEFQAHMPHRLELWDSLVRIRKVGYEKWFQEMNAHYSCPQCNTLNSAYDIACRKCGASPGNDYVVRHNQEVMAFISQFSPP
jgi:hypothetical protein